MLGGLAGAVVGLIIGLRVYAPTAWAAMVEIGLPAALAGGVLGAAIGGVALAIRRAGVGRGQTRGSADPSD